MSTKDWDILINYIISQFVRTPSFYKWLMKHGQQIVPSVLEEVALNVSKISLNELKKNPSNIRENSYLIPLEIKNTHIKPDDKHTYLEISTVLGKNIWLIVILNILSPTSDVNKHFHNYKWSIVSAPDNCLWPTCDNPFIITKPYSSTNQPISWQKTKRKYDLVIFPISPTIVLIGQYTRTYPWRFVAQESFAEYIKKLIIMNADRFIYAKEPDSNIINYRHRIINKELFDAIHHEYNQWYKSYKEIEAPLISKEKKIIT